jgi:hypothetical protein
MSRSMRRIMIVVVGSACLLTSTGCAQFAANYRREAALYYASRPPRVLSYLAEALTAPDTTTCTFSRVSAKKVVATCR